MKHLVLEAWQKNALELSNFIESEKYAFDLDTAKIDESCGTAGCVAGHADALWTSGDYSRSRDYDRTIIIDKLSLEGLKYEVLCLTPLDKSGSRLREFGWSSNGNANRKAVTRSMAVATLRRYAMSGEVYYDLED